MMASAENRLLPPQAPASGRSSAGAQQAARRQEIEAARRAFKARESGR